MMQKGILCTKSSIKKDIPLSEKKTLRKHFQEIRRNISQKRRLEAKESLYFYLEERISTSNKILSFTSFGDEIELSHINALLEKQGKLYLCAVRNEHLIPCKITDMAKELAFDKYKFLEPNPALCKTETHFDLILVPGIAFDERGVRLGFGKGHYDRLLSILPPCITIGIGFQEQLSMKPLPCEVYDIKVKELCLV